MKVGVIGGGLMGLALARNLSAEGHEVDVFERDRQLGGLTTYHDYGSFLWDRFYHVILPSDRHLIQFIRDIGLGDELCWSQTRTGFFVDGKMHSISNNIEFLKFPLLSLVDKFRLAFTLIYSSRINDWEKLEGVTVEEWLRRVSGNRTYEKMWRPLLLAKLGDNYRRVSAVFIWSYIKRLFSARDSSASKEQLGHVSGGYKQVFDTIEEQVVSAGGRVLTHVEVENVTATSDAGLRVHIAGSENEIRYDKVVCTSPVPILKRIVSPDLLRITAGTAPVEYLGVVCMVLVTRRPIVSYYVVNIADSEVPFTGIIGMSSVVDPGYTDGLFLTYLPKYVLSSDDWFDKDDEEIERRFLDGLHRVVPEFDQSSLVSSTVNRARRVQPLQVLGFSSLVPKVETDHPDLYVLNTAQFVNATLNNNEVVRTVNDFVAAHAGEFKAAESMQ